MARISKCDKLPEQERLRLVGRIGEGVSWPQLAKEFGIPQSTIAEWATRNGYGRSPVAAKRKAVDSLLIKPEAGSETGNKSETGNPDIDAAAERDAKVIRLSSANDVAIMMRINAALKDAGIDLSPNDLRILATANATAADNYAKRNKLDDTKPELNNDFAAAAEAVRRKLGL